MARLGETRGVVGRPLEWMGPLAGPLNLLHRGSHCLLGRTGWLGGDGYREKGGGGEGRLSGRR